MAAQNGYSTSQIILKIVMIFIHLTAQTKLLVLFFIRSLLCYNSWLKVKGDKDPGH